LPSPRAAGAVLLSAAALVGFSGQAAEAQPTSSVGLADCVPYLDFSKYHNHEYEVCTAYVANSAEIALQGFYKFGRSPSGARAGLARHHFESRYYDGPRQAIEGRVDSWPSGENKVDENIDVQQLSSSLSANRALLTTLESWQVTAPDGHALLQEQNRRRGITMCKIPGLLLHKWVVAKFSRDPNFNCNAFATHEG